MRIISGKFKGRKLKAPEDLAIRPTLDRVKESIFNVLGPGLEGKKVLDLFSGTGSLGLEALSRGAGLVHFVDKSPDSIELIKYNTSKMTSGLGDIGEFEIIQDDICKYLRFCIEKKWDIIFLDPPYRIDAGTMKEIFDTIADRNMADADTVLVYEFFFKREIQDETSSFKRVKESFFGDKKVIYLEPRKE